MNYELSVIIPVYNEEKYISECLESIINQTLGIENIEVIIVNDNSTDNTLDIIKSFDYPSIKIINNNENLGAGKSKNKAIKEVNANYLTFMDADDFVSEDTFEIALDLMKQNKSDMLIYNWKHFPVDEPSIHKPNITDNQIITDISQKENLIFSTSMANRIFHKNLYKYLNFSDLLYDDNEVAIKTLLKSKNITLMKDGLYYYRKNLESLTQTITIQHVLDLIKSIKDLSVYPEAKPLIDKFVDDILFWFYYYQWFEEEEQSIINNLKTAIQDLNFKDKDIELLKTIDSEFFIPYYKDKKRNPLKNATAKLYVDTGKGFNENETIEADYIPNKLNSINFNLDSFKNIKNLRFDPIGNAFVKVHIADSNLDSVDSNCDNDINDYYNVFSTLDPWYILNGDYSDISEVNIKFELRILNDNELNNLFTNKNKTIKKYQEKNKELENSNNDSKKKLFKFR